MPSSAITICLNANQSKKATILIPADLDNPLPTILKEAHNKFRIKALNQVYRKGGALLSEGEALGPEDKELWITKGEPYAGPPPVEKPWVRKDGLRAEVRVLAENSFVDEQAVKQLEAIAQLPGVRVAVGLPDLHPGNRFPIGCAVAADGVYPALIGSDVGCGIALYTLSSSVSSSLTPQKVAAKLHGLDAAWSGDVSAWLARYGILQASPFDRDSLGTVGSGNHFAEICTIERFVDPQACEALGLTNALYLLVHSGSRGLGQSILRMQTAEDPNPYMVADSPELESYLAQHDNAVIWARANRDLIALRINDCLFPGRYSATEEGPSGLAPLDLGKILDITHNSVTQHQLQLESGEVVKVWIHRKGAAPADKGPVPCPGSRGDFSWLLNPSGDGNNNAYSLAHGAGRLHPRSATALRNAPKPGTSLTVTALGSHVVCGDPELLIEERPEAYKSVQGVIDDMSSHQIASGLAVLRPFVTFKVGDKSEKYQK